MLKLKYDTLLLYKRISIQFMRLYSIDIISSGCTHSLAHQICVYNDHNISGDVLASVFSKLMILVWLFLHGTSSCFSQPRRKTSFGGWGWPTENKNTFALQHEHYSTCNDCYVLRAQWQSIDLKKSATATQIVIVIINRWLSSTTCISFHHRLSRRHREKLLLHYGISNL